MKKAVKYTSTGSNAGKKPVITETPKKSYTLIRRCNECPVYVYRDIICNEDLTGLVREGDPPKEALDEAAALLIAEYGDLVNGESGIDPKLKQLRLKESLVTLYSLCLDVVSCGHYDEAIKILQEFGLSVKTPENDEQKDVVLKKIESRMKSEKAKYQEAVALYQSGNKKDARRLTEQEFDDQITNLRILLKDPYITDRIFLSEYASYLRIASKMHKQNKK